MNTYLLLTFIGTFLIGVILYLGNWKIKHILSIMFSFIFAYLFATYGASFITPLWKGINASDLWLVTFLIIYVGSGIIGILPFLFNNIKRNKKKIYNIITFWLVLGLVYTATDNIFYGPFAVGPNSPYINQSLCHLNPTYLAEDVWFGCQLEKLGIDTKGELANFLTYWVFSFFLYFIAILLVGFKFLEKLIYPDKKPR